MEGQAVDRRGGSVAPAAAAWPGPRRSIRTLLVYGPGRDPLSFFGNLARTYGDFAHVHMAGDHVYLVNDPRAIRDILVTDQRLFMKGRGLDRAKRLLGKGLLTSEGAVHVRQRRLMQPAFHRDRIASYATVMTEFADRVRGGWTEGARRTRVPRPGRSGRPLPAHVPGCLSSLPGSPAVEISLLEHSHAYTSPSARRRASADS